MRFLDTNQVGFDKSSLGFPSVGSCQALVYQTDIGLFGFHASSSNLPKHKEKCEAFARYVQNCSIRHGVTGNGICVIGVITGFQRFGDKDGTRAGWGDEVAAFAEALHFDGERYGAQVTSHVEKKDSLYVRFDWDAKVRCTVRYKRWTKMDYYQTGAPTTDEDRRNLAVDPSSRPTPNNPALLWLDVAPATDEQTVHRKKRTDEGKLRTITTFQRF